MPRIPLTGGAYQARSLIANAQRCINLFPEANPPASQAPVPVTHYPTPGITKVHQYSGGAGAVRCLYFATNVQLYAVINDKVLVLSPTWGETLIGSIAPGTTPVSMVDNGTKLFIVDGTAAGYTVDLATNTMTTVSDAAFYGATTVAYDDTFFVFNRSGTQQFYVSDSEATTFDPLYFAAKVGAPDLLVAVMVVRREIWLIGERTTEIWINGGGANFPFQIMNGAFIEHGCAAKYSVAKADTTPFWLSQDKQGGGIVLRGEGYEAKRISTHALESEFQGYPTLIDAVGFTYQLNGHTFYVLTFPSADKTWAYDIATEQWHQWAWMDTAGALHRHRAMCATVAYFGQIFVGDHENGCIYRLDADAYTDDGQPIQRIRSFPHLVHDANRVMYWSVIADMEVGTTTGDAPVLTLRWSDTRGASWGTPITADLGAAGDFLTSVQFNRLGMGRDRVFEVSWNAPVRTALNGLFVVSRTAEG